MSIPTDELKNRLKLALAKMNMRPIELSEITKIPKSSISQYMSGYAKPNSERVYLISKALNVSEAWLLGFDVSKERFEENTKTVILTPREQTHINKYRKLDDHSKDVVDTIIDKELERSANNILHRVPTFEEMFEEQENKVLSTDNLGDDGYIHEAAFGGGVWKEKNEVDE